VGDGVSLKNERDVPCETFEGKYSIFLAVSQ